MVGAHSHGVSRVPCYSGYSQTQSSFKLQGFHLLWLSFPEDSPSLFGIYVESPNPSGINPRGLGCSAFVRHYLRNRFRFLFLRLLRCFNSAGSLLYTYFVQCTVIGLPHSEIPGSKRMCRSPRLIAACHVLLRLVSPRHPPIALSKFGLFCSTLLSNYLLNPSNSLIFL